MSLVMAAPVAGILVLMPLRIVGDGWASPRQRRRYGTSRYPPGSVTRMRAWEGSLSIF
jgi:hypothetical protein